MLFLLKSKTGEETQNRYRKERQLFQNKYNIFIAVKALPKRMQLNKNNYIRVKTHYQTCEDAENKMRQETMQNMLTTEN